MIEDPTRAELERLREQFPGWKIWTVARAVSKPMILWCAKPQHETKPILNADSATELAQQIRAQRI